MKRAILLLILFLALQGKGFCQMNPLSQIALDLKQKGYPQALVPGEMTFSPNGNQYVQFAGNYNVLGPNWAKVPTFVDVQNQLKDCNYTLQHTSTPGPNGVIIESWILTDNDTSVGYTFTDPNIWVVITKYWMLKKGK